MLELREEFHTGIVIVTHNLGVAAYMADKIVVMKDGKIVDMGDREYILKNSGSEYTKKLLDCVPSLEGERYV
jgi:peptide/nickel transport system ATP-binding protein